MPDAAAQGRGRLPGRLGARKRLSPRSPATDAAFAAEMARYPVAEHADAANAQHYELPPAFFEQVLGPRLKYSCCLYGAGETLAQAEERALEETARPRRPARRPGRSSSSAAAGAR